MASAAGIRPESHTPMVTAGFTWHPEMGPSTYARASNTKPNASAVATTPEAKLSPAVPNPNDKVATPTPK